MKQYQCRVIEQRGMCSDIWRLKLHAPELASSATAGQFVHLRVGHRIAPLLRRPFGIHRVHRKQGEVEILYRVVGEGTTLMTKLRPNDVVDLLGPLGNGFNLQGNYDQAVVVAGGMGIAPIFFLIDELLAMEKQVSLFWGARLCEEIFVKPGALKERGVDLHLAVEDGTMGHAGFVTDLLPAFLETRDKNKTLRGFACGPNPMLRTLQGILPPSAQLWEASLEARMACGVGVCMGCGVKHVDGGLRMVCSQGPVLNLREVILDN